MRNLILTLLILGWVTQANAQQVKSVYTPINLDKCRLIDKAKEGDGEWAQFLCKGFGVYKLYVTEADLRFYITFNKNDKGGQTLSPFNPIGKAMEWRLVRRGNGWTPFATIIRYYTDDSNGKKGQVLVVSRFNYGKTCHIAYIDALANKKANKLARFVADNMALNFNCKTHRPVIFGKRGRSPM